MLFNVNGSGLIRKKYLSSERESGDELMLKKPGNKQVSRNIRRFGDQIGENLYLNYLNLLL